MEFLLDLWRLVKPFFIPGLRRSNYGRLDGWYIELDGKVVGELLDYEWDDMFWDSYVVVPKDTLSWQILLQEESWFQFTFQNRRTGAAVANAFSHGAPN